MIVHIKILILLSSLLMVSCSTDLDRIRQVRTVADMQTIAAKIEAVREKAPESLGGSSEVLHLISRVAGGRDAWGRELLFISKPAGRGFSYVLVSMGSDGKSDVAQPQDYFSMPEQIIHGAPWKDIVFREGHAVTRAGK
jgi:hypothetical protein